MSDLSLAEKAVFHIVRRVQEDPNFAWHMLHTESLFLCMSAIAECQNRSIEEVRSQIEKNAASLRETPEIVSLREKLKAIEDKEGEVESPQVIEESSRIGEVERLLWLADCGASLTPEKLRAVLCGKLADTLC